MDTAYVVIAILVMLHFAGIYSRTSRVAALAFRLPYLSPLKGSELPQEYQAFHRAASVPLRKMGYKLVGVAKQRSSEKQDNSAVYVTLFYNQVQNGYAWLHNSIAPVESDPVTIVFQTFFDNGVVLSTDNEFSAIHIIPSLTRIEHAVCSDNPQEIWQAHIAHVEKYKALHTDVAEIVVTAKQALTRYNRALKLDLENAISSGAVSGDEDSFYLGFRQSASLAKEFQQREKLRLKTNQRRMSKPEPNTDCFSNIVKPDLLARPQVDMAKLIINNLNSPHTRPLITWITFVLSGTLFCLFFGLWLGWDFVPYLLGVIIFHELGHFFAMRISGYSQTSIFFVPGLGAAAQGQSGSASYWQRLFVFYAGPIPGILLAFALWYFLPDSSGWASGLIMTLIILNWFNLLPFMPLDGGQAINLCFGENGRYIFAWVSAIGLLLMAWALSEPVLWVIGAVAAYSTFARSGLHNLRVLLQNISNNVNNEEDFFAESMRAMQAPAHRNLPFFSRISLLREFIEEFHMPTVKLHEKLLGIAIYLLSFFLPLMLFLAITFSGTNTDFGNIEPERDWTYEITNESNPEKSIELAVKATRNSLAVYDFDTSESYLVLAQQKLKIITNKEKYSQIIQALSLRLRLANSADNYGSTTLVKDFETYLTTRPQQNEDYVYILRTGLEFLQYSETYADAPIVDTVFSSLESFLISSQNHDELAALYSQQSYYVDDNATRLSWLEKALKVAPEDEKETYAYSIAMVYLDTKEYSNAFDLYNNLHRKHSDDSLYNLDGFAWAAYKTERYDKALRLYDEQFEIYKDSIGGFSFIITLLFSDTSDYYELDIRLNQLIVADTSNNKEKVTQLLKAIGKLNNGNNAQWANELRNNLLETLKYADDGWHTNKTREKVKVLDRYFLDDQTTTRVPRRTNSQHTVYSRLANISSPASWSI